MSGRQQAVAQALRTALQFWSGAPPLQSVGSFHLGETAAQGASVILALAAVFSGMGGNNPLGLFYLLFPPLIWIATRQGLPAASWAVLAIQIGSIVGLEIRGRTELTLRAFQLFMFALARRVLCSARS